MDRSVLARKPMKELKDIASHLNMRGYQKLRKAELIDAIIASATADAGSAADRGGDDGSSPSKGRDDTARKVLPPGAQEEGGEAEETAAQGSPRSEEDADGDDGRSTHHRRRNRNEADDVRSGDKTGADRSGGGGSERGGAKRSGSEGSGSEGSGSEGGGSEGGGSEGEDSSGGDSGGGATSDTDDDADDPASSASRKRRGRRDRRKRNRERPENETQQGNEPGEVRAGVLDILPEGYGFLRTTGYLPGDRDVYVSQGQIRKHGLRRGDVVQGPIRQQRSNEKVPALHHVQKVNGAELEANRAPERPDYQTLVPVYPSERLRMETQKGPVAMRAIDMLCPIGKGQRALLVAPPAAGRTDALTGIGQAVVENHPEAHLMVLLIDERPEDVTEVERAIPGEVISSTFDRPVEDHTQVAELAIERAKRLVELGHDVIILLDSITRLARAYGHGDVDASSLFPTKRFFGAARNIEDGGSLTIIAATLVADGSITDEVIHEELVGAANAVISLDGDVAPHQRPAICISTSGTRREELLVEDEDLQAIWTLRQRLAMLDPATATVTLAEEVAATEDNEAFLRGVGSDPAELAGGS